MAVGAYAEDGTSSEGEVPVDDSQLDSGAAYVFKRDSGNWTQQAYLKASNADVGDALGTQLTLSADGNTLAVSSLSERSKALGINGDELDNSLLESGAVYVFTQKANTWKQEAYVKASNTDAMDYFGYSVSLSAEGDWLAVGAISESACDGGINADQTNNECMGSGAVYLFKRQENDWKQSSYIKASNTGEIDTFSYQVELSADGETMAVSSNLEDSSATGVNGNDVDDSVVVGFARGTQSESPSILWGFTHLPQAHIFNFFGYIWGISIWKCFFHVIEWKGHKRHFAVRKKKRI